jgi:ketosteroid isomerase-like protein
MTELGTGARSGAPSKQRIYAVLSMKDGKVRRYREFSDEQTALEAAGLSE